MLIKNLSSVLILLYVFFLISFMGCGCEKDSSPMQMVDTRPQFYPSHEFEWTADTLAPRDAFQVTLFDIWGTDTNNVWAVGHSDLNAYQIWHWDGKFWTNVNPHILGERASYYEIFGFAENDFWIAGYTSIYNGYLLHFDGQWHRVDNNELPMCMSIWGTSSRDLFIGCRNGIICRYDGEKFIKYNTGRNLQIHTVWGLKTGEVFAIGTNTDNLPAEPTTRYLFKYEGDNFTLLDSADLTLPGDFTIGMDLWGTDLNNLYSPTGNSLTKYENGKWITQFHAALYRVFGSSPHNIFTGGYYDRVYHYNGFDWKEVYSGNEVVGGIWGIWCTDEEVFIIQQPDWFTRILRGRQKGGLTMAEAQTGDR